MTVLFNVPTLRPLADFLPTLTIKAKDFAAELTSHNVVEKDLVGEHLIKILGDRGVKPETLPGAEDVKKVQRKLDRDDRKVLEESKKDRLT